MSEFIIAFQWAWFAWLARGRPIRRPAMSAMSATKKARAS